MTTISRGGVAIALVLTASRCAGFAGAGETKPVKMKASAIKVEMIHSDEIKLPAEFQVALYEDLIQQLQKKGGFSTFTVRATAMPRMPRTWWCLHSTVRGFKEGSEELRQVTTVAGATSISFHCVFNDKDGKPCWRGISRGMCDFSAGTCGPRYDFAKKTAQMAHDNFSPSGYCRQS